MLAIFPLAPVTKIFFMEISKIADCKGSKLFIYYHNMPKKQPHILVSITGRTKKEWQDKLREINDLKIPEIALFLELYEKEEKQKIYQNKVKSYV